LCGRLYGGGLMPVFRIGEAARLLGVSDDTLRRWANTGRVASTTTASGRRGVDGAELARLATDMGADAVPRLPVSACNQLSGLVTRVVRDQVMAQVDLQVGPHRIVSLMTVEAVDELGLAPGVPAVATVRSTSVIVTLPQPPRNDPARANPVKRSQNS
jgi:molybdopterin-binding protein